MRASAERAVQVLLVAALSLLGFFPLVNWLPGGRQAPWYRPIALDFVYGSMIALGGGLVLAILSRSIPALWRERRLTPLLERYERAPIRATMIIALGGFAIYVAVAFLVQDGRALHLDEIVQAYQGRIFASGALTLEAFPYPEFFSHMLLVDSGGRVYSHFPPGGPAMLALGSLIGAEWVIVPLAGALTVLAFGWGMQRFDERPGVRLGATLLFALAPFMVFMSASRMNHVTALLWIVTAVTALALTVTRDRSRPGLAFLSGIAFGTAATIRPADALAFALPAALWYLGRTVRCPRRWTDLAAAGIGITLPMAVLMWVNVNTTGHPLVFGYSVLWGEATGLGFHTSPWGAAHTPVRGLEQISLYFLTLQRYLFETPFPALVPTILALALSRKFRPLDRYLLVSSGLLVGIYFAYFHYGVYLGPRFMFPLLAVLVIWTARLPALVKERFGTGVPYRTTIYTYAIGAVVVVTVTGPLRARAHAANMTTPRWDAEAAAAAGVSRALVLVRESWGAQLLSRMWALGVTRQQAELLYAASDRCRLEQAISEVEQAGASGSDAFTALLPVVEDSARLVPAPFSEDPTARVLPGAVYSALCRTRVAEEQAGFTVFLPLILAEDGGNIFARDLHARDTLLLRAFPDGDVFLLKPPSTALGEEPQYYPLSRDSLYRAWDKPSRNQGVSGGR